MITRIAPTPSGYLHAGNLANALLVDWLAREHGGVVALRIDDVDATRARPEYVADVFDALAWLGIRWQVGPVDSADFTARWSARHRVPVYRAALAEAMECGLRTYACECSRSRQVGPAVGGCVGRCAERELPLAPGHTALRVRVPVGTVVDVAGTPVALAEQVGDFVVWRRDDLPAYQLASLVDDRELGTTDVVRGADLLASTAAQVYMCPPFGADTFARATFVHHDLVPAVDAPKLSKSVHGHGGPVPRTESVREQLTALAVALGHPFGIRPPA